MNLTVTDADIAELASRLQVAVDEAYQKGIQAERERISDIISDLHSDGNVWLHVDSILDRIDAAL